MTNTREPGDPRRVGRGLVTGGGEPAERTVTGTGQQERDAPHPDVEPDPVRTSLAQPGLNPDAMERHEEDDEAT